jgi:hypothetical protein
MRKKFQGSNRQRNDSIFCKMDVCYKCKWNTSDLIFLVADSKMNKDEIDVRGLSPSTDTNAIGVYRFL